MHRGKRSTCPVCEGGCQVSLWQTCRLHLGDWQKTSGPWKGQGKGVDNRNVPCKWACEVEEVGMRPRQRLLLDSHVCACVAVIKCNNSFVIPVMVSPPSQGRSRGPEILCLIKYPAQCQSHSGGIGTGSLVFRDQVIKNVNTFYPMAGHVFQLLVQRPHL